jgi:mRNA-degrading endonuclease RelE of RelBE toxin-antitoxin system
MNSIKWHVKALKQLRKIDRQNNAAIRDAVNGLAAMPECSGVKALVNHRYGYRLRVGAYRVLFDFDGEIRVVDIQEVKKRDERTY